MDAPHIVLQRFEVPLGIRLDYIIQNYIFDDGKLRTKELYD